VYAVVGDNGFVHRRTRKNASASLTGSIIETKD